MAQILFPSHRVRDPDWPGAREMPSSEKTARTTSLTICRTHPKNDRKVKRQVPTMTVSVSPR